MPLIDTTPTPIDNLLEMAGVKQKNESTLEKKLSKSRLGTEELLEGVADIISNGDTDSVRLQGIKIALQLNPETRQAMNDEATKQAPVFNIFIKDTKSNEINQILLPRKKPQVITIDAVKE